MPYKVVNITLVLLLSIGLLLLLLISVEKLPPVECRYKARTGQNCPTCGMTRDFVKLLKFKEVNSLLNDKSVYYFAFFVYAFLSRICFTVLIHKQPGKHSTIILQIDIISSSIVFISLIVIPYFYYH